MPFIQDFMGEFTDSNKINRPRYYMRMYWPNFWQPTVHVQQNIFEKAVIEVCSPHLYASFGTFCVQVGQLFEAQRVFLSMFENRQIAVIECLKNRRASNNWLIWKHKDLDYKLFKELFQKYFLVHERSSVKNSVSLYVSCTPDGLFWLNLHLLWITYLNVHLRQVWILLKVFMYVSFF